MRYALRHSALGLLALAFAACGLDVTGIAPLGGPGASVPDAGSAETGSAPTPTLDADTDAGDDDDDDGGTDAAGSDVEAGSGVTLTVVTQGDATAIVSSGDGKIACPKTAACASTYPAGTTVVLTATPSSIDSTLASWSVKSCGREPTCTVKLDGSLTVTAKFAPHVSYAHTGTQLYSIRSSDGLAGMTKTITGCSGDVNDLAIARNGDAFVVTGGSSTLYGFDLATAKCTKKGDVGVTVNALTFAPDPADPSADLLLAAGGSSLYYVDRTNGSVTRVRSLGSVESSGDLVWVPGAGLFISLTNAGSGGSNDRIAQIDLATGAVNVIGKLPVAEVWALAWRGNDIIGLGDNVVFTFNPKTFVSASLDASTGLHPLGAASGP